MYYVLLRRIDMHNTKTTNVILLLFLLLSMAACKNNNFTIPSDIQSQVPFKVILPTYLPTELANREPLIQGPFSDVSDDNIVSLTITFQRGGDEPKFVIIEEQNQPLTLISPNNTGSYLSIKGIQVFEDTISFVTMDGWVYNWNVNETNISVKIIGYNQNVRTKIIESMIK